eukprot:Nk52_evm34s123 gene=Nk52_evmTU34s123
MSSNESTEKGGETPGPTMKSSLGRFPVRSPVSLAKAGSVVKPSSENPSLRQNFLSSEMEESSLQGETGRKILSPNQSGNWDSEERGGDRLGRKKHVGASPINNPMLGHLGRRVGKKPGKGQDERDPGCTVLGLACVRPEWVHLSFLGSCEEARQISCECLGGEAEMKELCLGSDILERAEEGLGKKQKSTNESGIGKGSYGRSLRYFKELCSLDYDAFIQQTVEEELRFPDSLQFCIRSFSSVIINHWFPEGLERINENNSAEGVAGLCDVIEKLLKPWRQGHALRRCLVVDLLTEMVEYVDILKGFWFSWLMGSIGCVKDGGNEEGIALKVKLVGTFIWRVYKTCCKDEGGEVESIAAKLDILLKLCRIDMKELCRMTGPYSWAVGRDIGVVASRLIVLGCLCCETLKQIPLGDKENEKKGSVENLFEIVRIILSCGPQSNKKQSVLFKVFRHPSIIDSSLFKETRNEPGILLIEEIADVYKRSSDARVVGELFTVLFLFIRGKLGFSESKADAFGIVWEFLIDTGLYQSLRYLFFHSPGNFVETFSYIYLIEVGRRARISTGESPRVSKSSGIMDTSGNFLVGLSCGNCKAGKLEWVARVLFDEARCSYYSRLDKQIFIVVLYEIEKLSRSILRIGKGSLFEELCAFAIQSDISNMTSEFYEISSHLCNLLTSRLSEERKQGENLFVDTIMRLWKNSQMYSKGQRGLCGYLNEKLNDTTTHVFRLFHEVLLKIVLASDISSVQAEYVLIVKRILNIHLLHETFPDTSHMKKAQSERPKHVQIKVSFDRIYSLFQFINWTFNPDNLNDSSGLTYSTIVEIAQEILELLRVPVLRQHGGHGSSKCGNYLISRHLLLLLNPDLVDFLHKKLTSATSLSQSHLGLIFKELGIEILAT